MVKQKCHAVLLSLCLVTSALSRPIDLAGEWNARVESPQDIVTYLFKFDVKSNSFTVGAGDEARTRNFQLGKLNFRSFIFNTYKIA
jgi:hypothetical protein